jgi:outer membrane protein TolC
LRWRPPKLGELNEKTQFARSEYCDANVDFFNYRAKLVGQVRMAWHGQALLADQLKLALRREEIEARRLDVVTRLVNIGQVSFVKKVKAQTGVLKARRDVASARQELESGRSRLMALAGVDVPVEVAASVLPINPVGFEQIMKVAWESRPEVEAAAQRAALAQSRYRAEKMKLIPWLSFVEVAYHYEREKTDWGELMFGIELPIFNWAGKQAKAAAVASESRKSAGAAGIEAIEQDIRDAYSKWDSARAALELLMSQTDETRANVRQMMSEARRQAMPEDEILELELSDVELEDMLLDARRDYAEACIDLCVAAGVDNFNGLSGN